MFVAEIESYSLYSVFRVFPENCTNFKHRNFATVSYKRTPDFWATDI